MRVACNLSQAGPLRIRLNMVDQICDAVKRADAIVKKTLVSKKQLWGAKKGLDRDLQSWNLSRNEIAGQAEEICVGDCIRPQEECRIGRKVGAQRDVVQIRRPQKVICLQRRECPLGCNIMRENHESIIGNAGHGVESFHSRDALLNVRGLLTKRINSVVAEFPVGMVVAMDADGEPLWVRMK